ncbi:transposase [Ideonella sp. BN130291]|uniref:transposase n=1 Tax=Ideonella sp. BN130291 TaxID=3112940 RepID=UPI002E2620B8|nr:transposase [Ideonella sp. BN130291]
MARLPRLCIAGELHHLIQRGHNRQAVFVDDADRQLFLVALRDAAHEHGVAVHAYALLDSEVRLLATPATQQSLSKALQAVGRRYVAAFNRRHGRTGTLWEGRFRGAVIESERYFIPALCQLETAPVDAGLAPSAALWPWSSAGHHLGLARSPLVTEHRLYWALGNTPFDREAAYRRALEQGVTSADGAALLEAMLKSWAIGSPAFLARLADMTPRPLSARQRGRPRKTFQSVPN